MLASFVGGETPLVLIWFGLFFLGLLFIARALRDDGRGREKDDSITDLDKVRNLPLRHVKEAIRQGPPTAHADAEGSAPAKASRSRSIHGRTRGPIGLVK
jgi:hypothetical protein